MAALVLATWSGWVVCMFSPADAHIVVCDPERLPGPEAVVRMADCTRMIVKALQEGEHHALLLQARGGGCGRQRRTPPT